MVGLLDMVKVLSFALSEGKVAVHCHAGLGRTGKKIIPGSVAFICKGHTPFLSRNMIVTFLQFFYVYAIYF